MLITRAKYERLRRGWSLLWVAGRIGMHPKLVERVEEGLVKEANDWKVAVRLEDLYGVELADLLKKVEVDSHEFGELWVESQGKPRVDGDVGGPLVNVPKAAQILGVSPYKVRQMIKEGVLRDVSIASKRPLLRLQAVEDLARKLRRLEFTSKKSPVDMGPYKKLGELIRKYREQAGLSQVSLANRVGTNQMYISFIERGMCRSPKLHLLLARLCKELGIDKNRVEETGVRIDPEYWMEA